MFFVIDILSKSIYLFNGIVMCMETKVIPLVIIGVFLLACCMQQEKEEQQSTQLRGVSLSAKSFQEEDFSTFFEKAAQAGDIVMWAGDWLELTREGGAPIVVMELASTHMSTHPSLNFLLPRKED